MKYLLHLALVSVLLAGCADSPKKEASIEDREMIAAASSAQSNAKPGAGVVISERSEFASTAGTQDPSIVERPLAGGPSPAEPGVETRGVALQDPKETPLAGGIDKPVATAGENGAGAQKDQAAALQYEAQPVLDPKDPQSPLAQRRLLFDYDSSAIRDEYRTLLEMHAQYLIKENSARMILQGHADERGSREYNLALGQRRAESVFNALNLLGVPEAQMEAVSLGEEKPVVEGQDESAWAQNRRTEILYQGE